MGARNVRMEHERWHRVTEPDELFFYTLYGFRTYWALGKISDRAANRVKDKTGIDVRGYDVIIKSSRLVHFYNSHYRSQERSPKNRPITFDDVRLIPVLVNSFSWVGASTGKDCDSLLFQRRTPKGCVEIAMEIDYSARRLSGMSLRSTP